MIFHTSASILFVQLDSIARQQFFSTTMLRGEVSRRDQDACILHVTACLEAEPLFQYIINCHCPYLYAINFV